MSQSVVFLVILCCIGSTCMVGVGVAGFNVVDFGAVGDGKTDDSYAFARAWQAVCGAREGTPTLEVPQGKTFLIHSSYFRGPCASSAAIHIQMWGNIVAPAASSWGSSRCGLPLMFFSHVNGLIINGTGKIDGQGATWWNQATSCSNPPGRLIQFNKCSNVQLNGITSLNSPMGHLCMSGSYNMTISNVRLIAPGDSPNTDGIDIQRSAQIAISDSFIGTGDDCIAINGGSKGINITRITCGPGHGISIGSLGDGPNDLVEEVYVQSCTFNKTLNGARIKTKKGQSGYAKSIHFTGITLIAAGNPIVIDQHYCNGIAHGCPDQESTILVSNITYSGFWGTSASADAINLDCRSQGCSGIVLDNINITSSVPGQQLKSSCNNAHGSAKSTCTPTVWCLKP